MRRHPVLLSVLAVGLQFAFETADLIGAGRENCNTPAERPGCCHMERTTRFELATLTLAT